MPIRITCPSCSATLSVKDEFAGRAVKCPKCAGIIPPQQAPSTVSEPEAVATLPPAPPEPKKPGPFDEPAKPAKTGSKITGKPSPRSEADRDEDDRPRKKREEDDRDEEPRPKKRRDGDDPDEKERSRERDEERPRERDDRDEDGDDRPRRRRRDEDDDRDERDRRDEDDRPRRRRRAADDYDDDYDDDDRPSRRDDDHRPAHRRQPQRGNAGLIIAGAAILMCVVAVVAGYFVYSQREADNKAALNAANADKEAREAKEAKAAGGQTSTGYEKVKIGDTRAQADTALGKSGRTATIEDLSKVFRAPADKRRLGEWTPKVKEGRAVLWQSGEDAFVLVMFHPNPESGGRVQAKVLRTKTESVNAGDLDDVAFLKRYPSKEPVEPKVTTPKGEPLP